MNNKKHILYIGSFFSEDIMLARPAVSAAANRWQMGLISSLSAYYDINMLGHLPEPYWPKGNWRINKKSGGIPQGFSGQLVNYLNIPFLRPIRLNSGYILAFKKLFRTNNPPLCLLSYNLYPHTITIARYAQKFHNIPWVCMVADAPDPGHLREKHDTILNEAAGIVYLSWDCYQTCRKKTILHLDGGITELKFTNGTVPHVSNKKSVLFTGAMSQYSGVSFLIKSFKLVKTKGAELWLCGKGENNELRQATKTDSRIKWFGMVSEEKLSELSKAASIFVNPRPSALPASTGNFPSKILEYLSYGKPVISTWTSGLSPDYHEVLTVLNEETPECLSQIIDKVLEWDNMQRSSIAQKMYTFMNNRLWSRQADRLACWLNDEALTK